MIKRITLLRRRKGMSETDFRTHWATSHAEIAKGFEGLEHYNQNRVDEICWQTGDITFDVQGIVELWFASQEVVARNATSDTTSALIIDEPSFLSGLTAMAVGEAGFKSPDDLPEKYMILATTDEPEVLRTAIETILEEKASDGSAQYLIDPLEMTFTREALSFEPVPPTLGISIWTQKGDADGLVRGDESVLRTLFQSHAKAATAYLIDELHIV